MERGDWNMTEESYKAREDVVMADLGGGETALLDQATMRYFTLNETGRVIWDHLKEGASIPKIVEALVEAFEVTPEEAGQSAREFLEDLLSEGLIHKT